jgi:hypothetical protein
MYFVFIRFDLVSIRFNVVGFFSKGTRKVGADVIGGFRFFANKKPS